MLSHTKRSLLLLFLFLLLLSINEDLSIGISFNDTKPRQTYVKESNYTIVKVMIQSGDTVLSVMEQVNPTLLTSINIKEMVTDFQQINPNTNPYQLQIGDTYYFPLYKTT